MTVLLQIEVSRSSSRMEEVEALPDLTTALARVDELKTTLVSSGFNETTSTSYAYTFVNDRGDVARLALTRRRE